MRRPPVQTVGVMYHHHHNQITKHGIQTKCRGSRLIYIHLIIEWKVLVSYKYIFIFFYLKNLFYAMHMLKLIIILLYLFPLF
ncbi:hypothetical protein C1646_722042 [Rhizophagus diaphanus]|nr:hypothetical protein C1646_722042 [Rhizophagus diaphanus] [Rhizophagus sp. MUCL 43196]